MRTTQQDLLRIAFISSMECRGDHRRRERASLRRPSLGRLPVIVLLLSVYGGPIRTTAACDGTAPAFALLQGRVSEVNGAPIPDLPVVLSRLGTSQTWRVETDRFGAFQIPYLVAGQYSVSVAATSDFHPHTTEPFPITAGAHAEITLTLTRLRVFEPVQVVSGAARARLRPKEWITSSVSVSANGGAQLAVAPEPAQRSDRASVGVVARAR